MLLYHFTCHLWWHFIQTDGINRGEAPISRNCFYCFPNLTDNPDPILQNWTKGSALNKQAIRISVDIPENDENLISWRAFTDFHGMSRQDYRILDQAGGWQARNWWICRGVVTTDRFKCVDILASPSDKEIKYLRIAENSSNFGEFLANADLSSPQLNARVGELIEQ